MRKRDTHTVAMWDGPAWIEVRNRLVVENLAWAHGVAAKVAAKLPTWFLTEDLLGAAEIALIQMADAYRSYRSTPFRAFAIQRVRGACVDFCRRKEYRERAHLSIDSNQGVLPDSDKSQFSLLRNHRNRGYNADGLRSSEPSPERLAELEQMKSIWQHVSQLNARQATVIRAMYGEGLTNKETAQFMHVSEGYVSQLHSEALEMLRGMVKR